MPRLRVLHVIGGLELGGAETLLYRLATSPSAEFEHRVICLGPRDWYSSRLEERGIAVSHLDMISAVSSLSGLGRLRKLIRESPADVIQSWMYFANMLSSLSAGGIPVVWGIHGSTLEHLGAPSHFFARVGGLTSRWLSNFVINCSQRSAELHARLGYSAAPNAVIHNGYDSAAFYPDEESRAATRASLGMPADRFLVGSVSRWHSQKDIPNLLRAIRLAADAGVPMRCLLIGRRLDAGNPELLSEVRRLDCEKLVIPLGSRDDVQALARALDLHLLSSSGGEAFPNVVAETMLSGTPNIVTDVGDSALMVGESGWVVPAHDPQRMAKAIGHAHREWAEDRSSWEERRREARKRIAERFTFERMAEAYQEVWRRAAKKG
jgi:glycosyltransferase involved in cell wall biosynthesis